MVTTGAQLLDLVDMTDISAGGAAISVDSGAYTISGTGTLTGAFSANYRLDYLKKSVKAWESNIKKRPDNPQNVCTYMGRKHSISGDAGKQHKTDNPRHD